MIPVDVDGPPIKHSPEYYRHPEVVSAYQRAAQRFAANLTGMPPPCAWENERGIVMAGGGLRYFPSVWVHLRLLRLLGCHLPVQVWYLGNGEMDPVMRRLLERPPLSVETVDARKVEAQYPCRILCGWELKPYATLYSPFREVLFLDADCGPVRSPCYLFSDLAYRQHGAVFWPDYDSWRLKPDIWEIFGIDWMLPHAHTEKAFESGQYLINKWCCWRELRMALWYAEHSDFTFEHVYGDKECFHLAWRLLRTPYAMPPHGPGWQTHTILQYDFQGRLLFQHRCQDKWRYDAGNMRCDLLAHEATCWHLLHELRRVWSGQLWFNPAPTSEEQRLIQELSGRRFLYRRVGYDERPLRLEADRKIGEGSAACERRWDVFLEHGRALLAICGDSEPTCILQEDRSRGVWTGRWLNHERMPIELIPLGEEYASASRTDGEPA